jgi:hypothetical protein
LGIPTVRDRVVQMATLLILEPIFEADFRADCSSLDYYVLNQGGTADRRRDCPFVASRAD